MIKASQIQKAKLQILNRELSHVYHEICNPLTMIYNRANVAVEKIRCQRMSLSEAAIEFEKIEKYVERIQHFLSEHRSLIQIPDLESVKFETFFLRDEFKRFLEITKTRIEKKGVSLVIDGLHFELPALKGSGQCLILATLGLIENAFEQTFSLEKPQIQILIEDPHTGIIKIFIKDNGHGFSEESEKNFLKPFYSTKSQGLGAGLSWTHELLTAMDAELAIENHFPVIKLKIAKP